MMVLGGGDHGGRSSCSGWGEGGFGWGSGVGRVRVGVEMEVRGGGKSG